MFATWLLEVDLSSTLRKGSQIVEFRQRQPRVAGNACSNNTHKACKAEEDGYFSNWKKTSQIALEDFKCDQTEVCKRPIPTSAGPEMVHVI